MFCCAGLASICRSPSCGFRCCARFSQGIAIGCSSLPVGSYNTGLSHAFQLFCNNILGSVTEPGAPAIILVRSRKSICFQFPRQPSTIVISAIESENRSSAIDRDQPPYRPPDKPSDVVSLVAFCRRHHLAGPAVFLQPDRKSTRLNSSHVSLSRMPSSA